MKKTLIMLVSILALMAVQPAFSQHKDKGKEKKQKEGKIAYALEISGQITHEDYTQEGVTVDLYEGNSVIESNVTKKNGKFRFRLFEDHIYTIDLIKDGYLTKRISINTALPEGNNISYDFDFDIELQPKKEGENYDAQLAEYPSALISYDRRHKEFTFDKSYTKTYFEELEKEKE